MEGLLIIVEIASFDIQKIKNPKIQKEEYQKKVIISLFLPDFFPLFM